MTTRKPDYDYVHSLLASRKGKFATLEGNQRTDNEFYELSNKLGINTTAGYHEIRTGMARRIIDVPAKRLLGVPGDESAPRKATEKDIAENTRRKLFIKAFVDDNLEVIQEAYKLELLRGASWFRVLYDPTIWAEEPERKEGESTEDFVKRVHQWEQACVDNFPILIDTPDDITLYPPVDHTSGVPRDLIVSYKRTVGDVKAKWPNWNPSKTYNNDDDELEWIEFWSKEWRAYYADSDAVQSSEANPSGVMPNIYGFVPFTRILSGFGVKDFDGKPEVVARGLLWQFRDRLTALDRAVSFQDTDVALHSHRTGRVVTSDTSEVGQALLEKHANSISLAPGVIRKEYEGETTLRFELDDLGPVNEPLFAQTQSLMQSIESDAHTGILSGYVPKNVTSGLQQGMGLSWARAEYQQSVTNLEKGLSLAMGMVLRLIENVVQRSVTLRATMIENEQSTRKDTVLTPEDIDGYYTVEMKFTSKDPAQSDIKARLGESLYNSGAISHNTLLDKYLDFDDPEAERVQMEVERMFRESPLLQQAMRREVARGWGINIDEMMANEKAEAVRNTPQMPGQGGMQGPVLQNKRGPLTAGPGGVEEFPASQMQGI